MRVARFVRVGSSGKTTGPLLLLLLLWLGLLSVVRSADAVANITSVCPTDSEAFSRFMLTCRDESPQYTCLSNSDLCTGGFRETYATCNKTVSALYSAMGSSCLAVLSSVSPPNTSPTDVSSAAQSDCASTLSAYISTNCFPKTCPDISDLPALLPLAQCIVVEPGKLTASQLQSYSGYACLQEKAGTVGVPEICAPGSSIDTFRACNSSTSAVVNEILNSTSTTACTQIMKGSLAKYCTMAFGPAIVDFCTPTMCQEPFPGNMFGMCTGIGVVVGVIGGVIVLALAGVFLYKRHQKNRKLHSPFGSLASAGNNGSPMMGSSPKSPMLQQSSFTLSPFNGGGGSFAAYASSPPGYSMGSMPPGGSIPAPVPASQTLNPATLTVRKGELCDFYMYHDPKREDIPGHVDRLFDKYPFDNIVSAIRSKYGVVPAGW